MSEGVDVPFYLMPVAAVLGMVSVFGVLRVVFLVYTNIKYDPKDRKQPPPLIKIGSGPFVILVGLVAATIAGYAKIVGIIETAMLESEHALFDPYDLLGIDSGGNKTVITRAYRELVKIHHPDKGGKQAVFMKLHQAYKALTDPVGIENYQKFGHPDGPVATPGYKLALPTWLLFPEGNIALVMIVLYLLMMVLICVVVFRVVSNGQNQAKNKGVGSLDTESVGLGDLAHLVKNLSPTSTHWDVLLAIATTPENVAWSNQGVAKTEKLRKEKLADQNESSSNKSENKGSSNAMSFDIADDDGGWDDDNEEEDEAVREAKEKAAKAEAEKKLEMERLAKATGKTKEPMEGIDEGVLGQKWVENTLTEEGVWPPKELSFLDVSKLEYNGKPVKSILDHPGIRRNLCCTLGRLHSRVLNTRPELVEAGGKKLLDNTYFKSALEYRQRTGILLEACLRLSIALKSYELTNTVLETAALFKVGCTHTDENIKWFQSMVMKEYCILPKLSIKKKSIGTEDEDEIATNDLCTIAVDMERDHCEIFLKKKIEMYQRQGIPPQVALQAFREGWWFLVRAEKLETEETTTTDLTELFHNVGDVPPFFAKHRFERRSEIPKDHGRTQRHKPELFPRCVARDHHERDTKGWNGKNEVQGTQGSGRLSFYRNDPKPRIFGRERRIHDRCENLGSRRSTTKRKRKGRRRTKRRERGRRRKQEGKIIFKKKTWRFVACGVLGVCENYLYYIYV